MCALRRISHGEAEGCCSCRAELLLPDSSQTCKGWKSRFCFSVWDPSSEMLSPAGSPEDSGACGPVSLQTMSSHLKGGTTFAGIDKLLITRENS